MLAFVFEDLPFGIQDRVQVARVSNLEKALAQCTLGIENNLSRRLIADFKCGCSLFEKRIYH